MANRLTDSRKWDDDWFLELSPNHKLLWLYMIDKCNHAGIYKHSSKLEFCCLGCDIDWNKALEAFNNRVVPLKENKYFIPKFIEFQYGVLNHDNRCHKSAIMLLEKEGIKGLTRGLNGCKRERKDKGKDKGKDKELVKDKVLYKDYVYLTKEQHISLVNKFGDSNTDEWIDKLNDYIHKIGVKVANSKYKSHFHVIKEWSRRDEKGDKQGNGKNKPESLKSKPGKYAGLSKTVM